MRIVFMGTPDFAVSSLEALLSASCDVVGVVTNPDRPSGRGRKERPSPVKGKATEHGLPVLEPEDLQDPDFLEALHSWAPDLQVVVAFRILPKAVWSIPSRGSINLHASLLPDYKGAAPIQRAIMNGEEHTGVTTFFIEEGMDTGDILLQASTDIPHEMTAGELHDRLMRIGADLVLRTVKGIEDRSLEQVPQPPSQAGTSAKAPKLKQEDRLFDPSLPAKQVHDHIRGMSPFPAVQCELLREGAEAIPLKLLRTNVLELESEEKLEAGVVSDLQNSAIAVATGKGTILITELKPFGKRAMQVDEFRRGYRVAVGDRLK